MLQGLLVQAMAGVRAGRSAVVERPCAARHPGGHGPRPRKRMNDMAPTQDVPGCAATSKPRRMRELIAEGKPIISPGVHDALSARLLEGLGFDAMLLGGSSLLAARYGLPDLGLAGLGEMLECTRDVVSAIDAPCIADADDGYGDVRSVVRTVRAYEAVGVAALVLEDQDQQAKRPGDSDAQSVLAMPQMVAKLRAALAYRSCADTVIVARTDCYALEGIDGVLRRCEAYLHAGADGIFASGLATHEHLAVLGQAFPGTYKLIVQVEGSRTPWLPATELHAMGFTHIAYPSYLMNRIVGAMTLAGAQLHEAADDSAAPQELPKLQQVRRDFDTATRIAAWRSIAS